MLPSGPAASPDDAAPPSRGRHRPRWFWGISALLVLGSLAAVTYSDAPAPDVSDLAFEPVLVAEEQNLYAQLVAHGSRLQAAPLVPADEIDTSAPPIAAAHPGLFGGNTNEPPRLLERLLAGEGWTPERLARLSSPLEEVAVIAAELHRLPLAQGSIPKDFYASIPAGELRHFGEQLRLAVWARYHAGDQAGAVELARVGLDLGRAVRDARGPMIDYLTGISLQGASLTQMQTMAARSDVEVETLKRLLAIALVEDPLPDGFAHTLKNEFNLQRRFLTDHNAAQAEQEFAQNPPLRTLARTRLLFPLVYKRNLTIALFADATRHELAAVNNLPAYPPSAAPAGTTGGTSTGALSGCAHCDALSAGAPLRPINAHGRALLAYITPSLDGLRRTRLAVRTRRALLQVYLALRLHHLETGALPETLEALVPSRLPTIPPDLTSGAPLRYSREVRAVWSIGAVPERPLEITAPDQKIESRELFHRLDFAAPPVAPVSSPAAPAAAP